MMRQKALVAVVLAGVMAFSIGALTAQTRNSREDCAPYDPATLRLTDLGVSGWRISRADGAIFMNMDTKEDADTMMSVFKAHSALCYVGRDNQRGDRLAYVHHYWK